MGISIFSCSLVVMPNCNNVPDVLVFSAEVIHVSLCPLSCNNQIAIKIVTLTVSTTSPFSLKYIPLLFLHHSVSYELWYSITSIINSGIEPILYYVGF